MTDLQTKLNTWVRLYGDRLGKTFFLKDGVCSLKDASGQEYVVDLPENAIEVYFCAPIATLNDADSKPQDFEEVLKWNLWGHETQGGTLSFDEMTQRIVFHKTIPMDNLDENRFADAFSNFIGSVLHIKELWENYKQTGDCVDRGENREEMDPLFRI